MELSNVNVYTYQFLPGSVRHRLLQWLQPLHQGFTRNLQETKRIFYEKVYMYMYMVATNDTLKKCTHVSSLRICCNFDNNKKAKFMLCGP